MLKLNFVPVAGTMHHPFHLHGFRFLVKNMGQYKDEHMTAGLARALRLNEPSFSHFTDAYQRSRPPFKDTISIPSYGFANIRFRADNPGFWLMHCHYEWHINVGMGLVVQVGELEEMVEPPDRFPQCGNYMPDF